VLVQWNTKAVTSTSVLLYVLWLCWLFTSFSFSCVLHIRCLIYLVHLFLIHFIIWMLMYYIFPLLSTDVFVCLTELLLNMNLFKMVAISPPSSHLYQDSPKHGLQAGCGPQAI
jgi:hypothetical protein